MTETVHPRACGGNLNPAFSRWLMMGASPRLRGKRVLPPLQPAPPGCIPAPAGETAVSAGAPYMSRVHPRACGGNSTLGSSRSGPDGASPRLRGKPRTIRRSPPGSGCIPAPAGETVAAGVVGRAFAVHPRACGGNPGAAGGAVRGRGASPRLRGKLLAQLGTKSSRRCIPAPAGETDRGPRPRPLSTVHPRACGGNEANDDTKSADIGASPRLRGKHVLRRPRRGSGRCIPAPAGETLDVLGERIRLRVHPRACGGNASPNPRRAGAGGASPRLRGKRKQHPNRTGRCRCIPAPAGETLPVTIVTYSSQFTHHRPVLSLPALVDGFRGSLRTT